MRLKDYPDKDGMRVWLDEDELASVVNTYKGEDVEKYLAIAFAGRSGLRKKEVLEVTPADLVESKAGPNIRVQHGKGDQYRETPIPAEVYSTAETYAQTLELDDDVPLIQKSKRTLDRWVNHVAERHREQDGDSAWQYLGMHDLRRSWGTLLVDSDVSPYLIMEWGGWRDWSTFRDHYLNAPSLAAQRDAMENIAWL
jgi:integrase